MSIYGLIGLLIAFAGGAVSIVSFLVGHILSRKGKSNAGETLLWGAHIATIMTSLALTFCCALLVFCFMTGETSIQYVVQNTSDASGTLGWLFKLSGLWAGREGSLLFWAWLISVFNSIVAIRNTKTLDKLDNMALLVSQIVLIAFVGVLLFSESNMPFTATPLKYFDAQGNLTGTALLWGMNSLLEHWAMAIHPPTLFIGYAGLTIPFAYAIAALIVNDSSKKWVEKSIRYTIFSWLFLGLGIGLGAVWAYVVLGWGGYWGWDPVENASLLPWLIGVALIHSFTVYRQRGAFKRWSVMCTCLTFAFVILGTFITRSGLVDSVHAFEGDPVSLALFLSLIIASVVVGIIGLMFRWKSFGAKSGGDDIEHVFSKDAAYYFNNVIMVVFAFLLAYLTISSALPTWLPFGGQSVSAGTYNAIARPLGIFYCLIIAICPLLAWGKNEGKTFWKRARVPALCALFMFVLLMVYFFTTLLPGYEAIMAAGGTASTELASEGPAWYYNGLAVVGFLVASLLFFNSLFMLGRGLRAYQKKQGSNVFASAFGMLRNHASTYGGFISHWAMAIILVGLIGSSMYVTEKTDYIDYDVENDVALEDFTIQDYILKYTGNSIVQEDNGIDIVYTVEFDVYQNDEYIAHVAPSIKLASDTQQQSYNASVVSFPLHDLFVIYKGVNTEGAFSLDVRINPLISFVWIGFGLLMLGTLVSLIGKRRAGLQEAKEPETKESDIKESDTKEPDAKAVDTKSSKAQESLVKGESEKSDGERTVSA